MASLPDPVSLLIFAGAVAAVFAPAGALALVIARTASLQSSGRRRSPVAERPWRVPPRQTAAARTSLDIGDLTASVGGGQSGLPHR